MENFSTIEQFNHLENIEAKKDKSKKKKKRVARFISSKFSKWFRPPHRISNDGPENKPDGALEKIKEFFNPGSNRDEKNAESLDSPGTPVRKTPRELIRLIFAKVGIDVDEIKEWTTHLLKSEGAGEDYNSEASLAGVDNTTDLEYDYSDALDQVETKPQDESNTSDSSYDAESIEVLRSDPQLQQVIYERTEVIVSDKPESREVNSMKKDLRGKEKIIAEILRETDELSKENEVMRLEIEAMRSGAKSIDARSIDEANRQQSIGSRNTEIATEQVPFHQPPQASDRAHNYNHRTSQPQATEPPNRTPASFERSTPKVTDVAEVIASRSTEAPTNSPQTAETRDQVVTVERTANTPEKFEKPTVEADAKQPDRNVEQADNQTGNRIEALRPGRSSSGPVLAYSSMQAPFMSSTDSKSRPEVSATLAANNPPKQNRFISTNMSIKEMLTVAGLIVSLAMMMILLAQSVIN